jgi:hypothetical protein
LYPRYLKGSSNIKDGRKDGSKPLITIIENDFFSILHIRFYHRKEPHIYYMKIQVNDSNSINYQVESQGQIVQLRGVNKLLTEQLCIPEFINSLEID